MSDVAPDYVEQDQLEESPMQLLVPYDAESGNTLRCLNRLQSIGYEVAKEATTEHQTVYSLYPKPDRSVQSNNKPPSERGTAD